MIRTYEQRDGQIIPGKVVFTGSMAECQRVVAGLEAGTITMRQVRQSDFEPPAVPEQKLESPDGLSQTQDAPAAELPSDTPEQFISDLLDMLDMLDRLYQAGTINRNFPPDGRDKIKENLVRTLQVNPSIVRDTLEQFIREDTGAAEAKVMLARLNGLSQGKGPEYEYSVGDEGGKGRFLLMAYQKVDGGSKLDRTMFVGDEATCNAMLEKLRTGVLRFEDFCIMRAARVSCYTTKDGAELDALVDGDDKVYLGRRDHYDNCGHYLNHDHSLIHISDNERVFNVISGRDIPYTNAQLLETGYFTQEEFEKFTALHLNGPEKETEALFLVDDAVYLHIQTCDEGWDYTLYDKTTMRQLDGGQMAILDIGGTPQNDLRSAADLIILGERKLQGTSVEPVPLDVLDTLQAAEEHAVQAAVTEMQDQRESHLDELREHFAQEDASLLDTQLDEYPLPDPQMPKSGLLAYGYEEDDLIPVGPDAAKDLYDRDFSLYIAGTSGYFNMVFEPEELDGPGIWLYAIPRGEWERSQDFQQAVADRMQHQEDREKAFLNHSGDCFAIYQVKDDDSLRDIRFESMDWLKSEGQTVERGNYDLVYTAPLPAAESVDSSLDQLWFQFNNKHPADYQHPSMSVSDIIAIRRDGVLSCHYCDSVGFQQLPDFIKPENYLKNAEMSTEDDLGMIDGIINNGPKATVAELEQQARSGQPISLTDLAGAAHRERGEKKSVLAKLNTTPSQQERKKSAPKKSAERER